MAAKSGVEVETRRLRFSDVLSSRTVFSPMLEEHTLSFLLVGALRALLGKRSCALLFRPGEVVRSGALKHVLKRLLLRAVRGLPRITIITIMPFELDPAFSAIADDWIHDPQLWDLATGSDDVATVLADDIRAASGGRPVMVALGAQSRDKGFDFLSDVWDTHPSAREKWLFVAAGRISAASRDKARRFAEQGGLVIDRFVSDAELRDLYNQASIVWGCYAPEYDQASGIFGRAVQLGKPVVVRDGAYVQRLAQILDHPTLAAPWDDTEAVARLLATAPPAVEAPLTKVQAMRRRSATVLSRALGVPMAESAL